MTALYGLAALDVLDADRVLRALNDEDANVRVHSLRLAERFAGMSPAIAEKLLSMTGDASLPVRYQLAFSLRSCPNRNDALASLAMRDAGDAWMRFAALTSFNEEGDDVFAKLLANREFRLREDGREFLTALTRQIGAASRNDEVAAVAQSIATLPTADKQLQQALVLALVERPSRAQRREVLTAAGETVQDVLRDYLAEQKAAAIDERHSDKRRVAAIRQLGLGEFAEWRPLFSQLLQLRQPPVVQKGALDALEQFSDPAVAELVLEAWPRMSPDVRAQATETLLARQAWLATLLDAVAADKVPRSDFDPARISLLKQHPNEEITRRVAKLFEAPVSERSEVVERYRAALETAGERERGKLVFKKVCSSCHQLEGIGKAVGAELTAISDRGPAALLLNILDPNREVKPKFLSYVVATTDGRVLTGMIESENANSLTLRRVDGTSVSIQRTEIEALRSTGLSYMPVGLEKELDNQAMADLLQYLTSVPAETR